MSDTSSPFRRHPARLRVIDPRFAGIDLGSRFHKVLLLTMQLDRSHTSGRKLLCKLNHDVLREIYGEQLVLFELPPRNLHGMMSIIKAFKGHIDGLDEETMVCVQRKIQSENVGRVFVDGSNLGAFVKFLKKRLPKIEVTTFFHNVEARFFLGSLRQQKTLRALAVLMVNYLAERKSVKYGDNIICLSQRDSRLLQKIYGRPATHVSPMALQNTMPVAFEQYAIPHSEKFALFVGGTFYANRVGISWFVQHVVPRIHIKLCIVGRGFEAYRSELEREGKVQVIGAVDDLAVWYKNAHFVIAPIFDGSGMKTKVAEALMYGKKVVGTPEAFSGYEKIVQEAGWVCSTKEEFIVAVEQAQDVIKLPFDPVLRRIYEELYSYEAARRRLKVIFPIQTVPRI